MAYLPFILMAAGTTISAMSKIQEGKEEAKKLEYEAEKTSREKARMAGRQRALYAKSGVLLTEGSPVEVLADTAAEYEMDIQMRRQQAKSAKTAGYMGATSTLLTGFGQAWGALPMSKKE